MNSGGPSVTGYTSSTSTPSFLSCRVLHSVARGHDTEGPAHVQTRHPRLCRHQVRHRPFENPYPRIARRGRRNGEQGHPRRQAAGAGALYAFVTDTDLSCKMLDDLNCGHVKENLNGRQVIVVSINQLVVGRSLMPRLQINATEFF